MHMGAPRLPATVRARCSSGSLLLLLLPPAGHATALAQMPVPYPEAAQLFAGNFIRMVLLHFMHPQLFLMFH